MSLMTIKMTIFRLFLYFDGIDPGGYPENSKNSHVIYPMDRGASEAGERICEHAQNISGIWF